MAEKEPVLPSGPPQGATATKEKPKSSPKTKPKPPRQLPPWKVLLHNDDVNSFEHVIETIVDLTPLSEQDATLRATEANEAGLSLILVTHKERAELYQEQFTSKSLTTTIEPAE